MPTKKGKPYRRNRDRDESPGDASNFIRQWREAADMTQETLAYESGISLSSVSAYERGEINPSIDNLDKLSKALDVPRGLLLDVDPSKDPPLWASVMKATSAGLKAKK